MGTDTGTDEGRSEVFRAETSRYELSVGRRGQKRERKKYLNYQYAQFSSASSFPPILHIFLPPSIPSPLPYHQCWSPRLHRPTVETGLHHPHCHCPSPHMPQGSQTPPRKTLCHLREGAGPWMGVARERGKKGHRITMALRWANLEHPTYTNHRNQK